MAEILVKRWGTIQEAAEYSGISERSLIRMLDSGKLTRYMPLSDKVLIDLRQLDDAVRGGAVTPGSIGRPKTK